MQKDIIKVRDKDRLILDYKEKREEGYTSPASALPTHELRCSKNICMVLI